MDCMIKVWCCWCCWVEKHLSLMTVKTDPVFVQGHGLCDLVRLLPTMHFYDMWLRLKICARWMFSIYCILLPFCLSKWKIAHSGTELFQMKLSARKLSAVGKLLCTHILSETSWAASIPIPKPQKVWRGLVEGSLNFMEIYSQHFSSILWSVKPE